MSAWGTNMAICMTKTCECGKEFTDEESSGVWCFPCKLNGLSFNWVGGGGYTREAFSSGTVKEHIDTQMKQAAANGTRIEKVPTRAELI